MGKSEDAKDEVAVIEAERLSLVLMSQAFILASLSSRLAEAEALIGASLPDSWPAEHLRRVMTRRLMQMSETPEAAAWLLRAMVRRHDSRVVGYINFHGLPDDRGRAELGYTVFEEYRRQGYATEAAVAMMGWAQQQQHGVEVFVVSISPSNEASLRLAASIGFERTGSQIDDLDGEEWVFELRLGKPAAS